jgi:hypothetical protein
MKEQPNQEIEHFFVVLAGRHCDYGGAFSPFPLL